MDQRRTPAVLPVALLLLLGTAAPIPAQSLTGSLGAMQRQLTAATEAGVPMHETVTSVYQAILDGGLVRVRSTPVYRLHVVSFPYARPEILVLLGRLAPGYRRACGQRLVITSLTRPRSEQPRNASRLSVHPAGLAVDVRRSHRRSCRQWLEGALLDLERDGLVEATRERWPAHYHIAALPMAIRERWPGQVAAAAESTPMTATTYQVHSGDTLWAIARKLGSSPSLIRAASGLPSTRIYPGQTLQVPLTGRTTTTPDRSYPLANPLPPVGKKMSPGRVR